MSNNIEDLIRDLINDAINELIDDQLEDISNRAYDDTREVDYRVDNADKEISDLKSEVIELERRLDSLEEKYNES
jgi:hypothetical protein